MNSSNSTNHSNIPLRFPNVIYGRYQVWQLSPEEIDDMLLGGWFRNDRHVHTTLGRFVEHQWRPVVMLRLLLAGFSWKKRLRKRLRVNASLFEVRIRPFVPRIEIETLWKGFKSSVHQWRYVPDLHQHIFKGASPASFHTYEVGVYYQGKLVAFSLFDKGKNSIASLEAAYDISFNKYSLGIYTMLLEINFCIENSMDYYYPGFYPKGTPMFDYKLRPGHVEYYSNRKGKWLPWANMSESEWLLDEMFAKLRDTVPLLKSLGLEAGIKAFNHLSSPEQALPTLSDYNFLTIGEMRSGDILNRLANIAWDPIRQAYLLFGNNDQLSTIRGNAQALSGPSFHFQGFHKGLGSLEKGLQEILADYLEK